VSALPGCGQGPTGTEQTAEINVHPTSFEEAKESIEQIAALQRKDPQDARALSALQAILPSLDALNHLVARVQPKTGHVVSFYESAPGAISVSESGPIGEVPVLAGLGEQTAVDGLYRKLTRGAEPPTALVEAVKRAAAPASDSHSAEATGLVGANSPSDGPREHTGTVSQGLTTSDGQWYTANGCYHSGEAQGCLPDWWNGGWAEANTKTSFINVAALTGTVYLQGSYQGVVVSVGPIFDGQWLYFWRQSGLTCVATGKPGGFYHPCWWKDYAITDQRWDIIGSTGQEFDWSYEYRWNCNYDPDEAAYTGFPLCANP
jgi:hypothetical protein